MYIKNGIIKGNEELNECLIKNEQILLEEKISLEEIFEDTQIELCETFNELKNLHIKNQKFNDYKKSKRKQFVVNFFEILVTMILFAVTPNVVFDLSVRVLNSLYIILGGSFVIINSILYVITKDEINDYIKNENMNDYNGKNISYLEEKKESIEEHIEELKQQMRNNENKLNKLHNSFSKRGIVSPRNNEYSSDETVKSKQKVIEK